MGCDLLSVDFAERVLPLMFTIFENFNETNSVPWGASLTLGFWFFLVTLVMFSGTKQELRIEEYSNVATLGRVCMHITATRLFLDVQ
jgi:hypothetical protein